MRPRPDLRPRRTSVELQLGKRALRFVECVPRRKALVFRVACAGRRAAWAYARRGCGRCTTSTRDARLRQRLGRSRRPPRCACPHSGRKPMGHPVSTLRTVRQSPREHGSRFEPSARAAHRVKPAHLPSRIEHGLPTGCCAVVGNPPCGLRGARRVAHNPARWTTLRSSMPTASTAMMVGQ